MINGFAFDNIRSVDFHVALAQQEQGPVFMVPVDASVQEGLKQILDATVNQLNAVEDELPVYEISEKYASKEFLRAPLVGDEMGRIRELLDRDNSPVNVNALDEPSDILYYYAVFRDVAGNKLIGVRRATYFKGVVKSKLIRLVDDTLKLIEDHVFKLDADFDFLIIENQAYILRPAAFEYVASIDAFDADVVRSKAIELGGTLTFIDFETIAEIAANKRQAARLVMSLRAQPEIANFARGNVVSLARQTGVELENADAADARLKPSAGHEVALLELLDRRRYQIALSANAPEVFYAGSRRPVANRQ